MKEPSLSFGRQGLRPERGRGKFWDNITTTCFFLWKTKGILDCEDEATA